MKHIFTFFTLLISFSALAQSPYIPIVFKNARFNYHAYSGNLNQDFYRYERYKKDSNINGLDYAMFDTYKPPNYLSPFPSVGKAYYRNDSSNRKVYSYDSLNGDKLFYDFSKQIGDTLIYRNFQCILYLIDSIQINSVWHRQFNYDPVGGSAGSFSPFLRFIEGIGFDLESSFEYISGLECYSIDSTEIFPSTGNACSFPVGLKQIEKEIGNVNCINSILKISNFTGDVQVINMQGNQVFKGQATSSLELNLSNHQGIYLVRLMNKDGYNVYKIQL
jgi:hypothetical protein